MNRFSTHRDEVELIRTPWGSLRDLFSGKSLEARSKFSFGLISYRQPHHSGRHLDHELIYILQGKGTARIGNEAVSFKPGALLVIPKDTEHGIEEVHGTAVSAVVVHFL